MDDAGDPVGAARAAMRARDWVAARDGFIAAREAGGLSPEDHCALADCHWWLGELDIALAEQQDVYRVLMDAGETDRAALVALDIGYTLSFRGEQSQGSGWIARSVRLLRDGPERAAQGYVEFVVGFDAAFARSDLDAALAAAEHVHALGLRFSDATLVALGVLGQGRVRISRGEVAAGMALLDEAMVAAVADTIEPAWAGNIYCNLMEACDQIADLARAAEWTEATARWCERMPGAGPFLGICRVHRAQVLHVRGAWDEAEREALRVCEDMGPFSAPVVAEAHYQLGEIRRQRGDLVRAEKAYLDAHRMGREPQPGLALLRLARGQGTAAQALVCSALAAEGDPCRRARLLPAAVEIAVSLGDLDAAQQACGELGRIAEVFETTGFAAQAATAEGRVRLARGEAQAALPPLRDALQRWQALGAPYEVGRVRRLLAAAHDALGNGEAAALERAAAAAGESEGHDTTTTRSARRGLTQREAEVLVLVAAGKSNQQIADELVLSVRTVERHLAGIYDKLGVHGRSARAAAVSYALRGGHPA